MRLATLLCVLFAAWGCASENDPDNTQDTQDTTATSSVPTEAPTFGPPTLASLTAKLGCTTTPAENPFARESGSGCKIATGSTRLDTYNDEAAMNRWYETWKGATGGGVVVWGDLWLAHATDMPTAEAVKVKLGGEIR